MIKNRLEYALLLLALGVFHVFLVDYLSFYVFVFFLILPVLSVLVTLAAARGIRIQLIFPKGHIRKQEELPLQWKVRTDALFLTCRLKVKVAVQNELMPEVRTEMVFFLMAGRQEQTVEQKLNSEYCGRLEYHIRELRVMDYLGLFSFRRRTGDGCDQSVFVLPTGYPLKAMDGESILRTDFAGEEASAAKPGDDPSDIHDIREYRSGDRFSKILWKMSDKYGEVMVRDFAHTASDDMLLLFDLDGSAREMDALLDTVRSVSGMLVEHGVSHDLEWYDSLHRRFMHADIAEEEDLLLALDAVLSGGRRQERPLALLNCGTTSEYNRYADVIYIGSLERLSKDALTSLRDRLTGSRIRVLALDAASSKTRDSEWGLAAVPELSLTVIDTEKMEKSLSVLVL